MSDLSDLETRIAALESELAACKIKIASLESSTYSKSSIGIPADLDQLNHTVFLNNGQETTHLLLIAEKLSENFQDAEFKYRSSRS